jgi:hypothetical protein
VLAFLCADLSQVFCFFCAGVRATLFQVPFPLGAEFEADLLGQHYQYTRCSTLFGAHCPRLPSLLRCSFSIANNNDSILVKSALNPACNMVAVREPPGTPPPSSRVPVALIAGAAGGGAFVLIIAAAVCYCRKRRGAARKAAGASYAQLAADPINRA